MLFKKKTSYKDWNRTVVDPHIIREIEPSSQYDAITKEERPVQVLHIKDPISNQTLIRLRNPKLAIKGFNGPQGHKCINLQ